jgi:hypothetical protein
MTSQEKVVALLHELLEEPPGEDAPPWALMLHSLSLTGMLDHAALMLPEDPGELDGHLEWLAGRCLEMRSDGAELLAIIQAPAPA